MKFIKNLFTQDDKKFQLKRDHLFFKNHDVKVVLLKWFCTLIPILIYVFCVLNLSVISVKSTKHTEYMNILLVFSWLNLILIPLFCINIIYDKTLNIEIKYSLLFILIMNIVSSILIISLWSGKNEDDDDEIYELTSNMTLSIKIITIISWLTFIAYPLIIWVSLYYYEPSCREYSLRTLKSHKNITDLSTLDNL